MEGVEVESGRDLPIGRTEPPDTNVDLPKPNVPIKTSV